MHTITDSINFTNALGEAIRRVRESGIRGSYIDFSVDIRSDSFANKVADNPSFLLGGTYTGNLSIMIDDDGVIHEKGFFIDNYNFERHDENGDYGNKQIIELNNKAALSMQAGYLTQFTWIIYIDQEIVPYRS